MARGVQFKPFPDNTGGTGRASTGLYFTYRRKPIALKYLQPKGQNGEVRIIKAARKPGAGDAAA